MTTDALFTQSEIAHAIRDAGGDYLMEVKGNQPTLHEDLLLLVADPQAVCACARETRLHSGRIEHRQVRVSTELTGYVAWPGFAQAVCVDRRVTDNATGETRTERAYAITSLAADAVTPAQLPVLWREH